MNKPDLQKELTESGHYRVVVFGSARPKPDDPVYKDVFSLGKAIAAAGFDIVTGGGPGVMEAANKGHQAGREEGADIHSFGLNIKLPFEQKPNPALDIEKTFERFSGRLDEFMQLANIFVFAPGGVGTSLEFFYTWQLMQVQHTCHVPLIMIGDQWKALIEWVKRWPLNGKYLDEEDLDYVMNVDTCGEAMAVIMDAYHHFKEAGDKACLNWKKYKIDKNM